MLRLHATNTRFEVSIPLGPDILRSCNYFWVSLTLLKVLPLSTVFLLTSVKIVDIALHLLYPLTIFWLVLYSFWPLRLQLIPYLLTSFSNGFHRL